MHKGKVFSGKEIAITIFHNLVKKFQDTHEICSIAEALGKEEE